MRHGFFIACGLLLCCALIQPAQRPAGAQNPPNAVAIEPGKAEQPPTIIGNYDWREALQWQLEEVELRDGRKLQGLIQGVTAARLDFLEVRRPTGQPTFLVKRRLPGDSVLELRRLDPAEHNALAEKVDRFQNHSLEEIRNMAGLALGRVLQDGASIWNYQNGPWFELESQTDEELTRRAIVRIEQMFNAFAEILPPRTKPSQRLRVRLFASQAGYREFQQSVGLNLKNPAIYVPERQLLAAGSDLQDLAQRLALVRSKHTEIQQKMTTLAAEMPRRFQDKAKEYEQLGYSKNDIVKLITLHRVQWQRELDTLKAELNAAESKNNKAFDAATRQMFTRLYHEAFHAYLENFVYPHTRENVPRWLNEGLAQVFEEGVLEVGTLRLDIPRQERLLELQQDFKTMPRLPLAELLSAAGDHFLVEHTARDRAEVSQRYYLYSWGLAYYLAVREPVLENRRLDRYVSAEAAKLHPQQRFEELVGMPLDQFEQRWRASMTNWDLSKQ